MPGGPYGIIALVIAILVAFLIFGWLARQVGGGALL
jgi:hypothetical protein